MLNLWNLLRIRRWDLVVAREGQQPVGICQATENGWQSYRHDPAYNYANTVSHPVNWVDWTELWTGRGDPPNAPALVPGIIPASERTHQKIAEAWVSYIRRQTSPQNE